MEVNQRESNEAARLRTAGRSACSAVLILAFVSGAITLAYEVLWTRELVNLLGSTTRATAVVLAAFMAGFAIGAGVAGRWTSRTFRPLWLYAGAEGSLAAIGLIFPDALNQLTANLPGVSSSITSLVFVLTGPAFLMGIALPALAAALQDQGAVHPKYTARLYGLNTLGGAIAASLIGFGSLPAIGLVASQRVTAATGMLAALAAASLALQKSPRRLTSSAIRIESTCGPALGFKKIICMAAVCLSGVAAFGYELLWTRILVLVVGSSTNAFTVMLSLYLLGLAIGGLWIGRVVGKLQRPALSFQILQLGVASAAVVGAALFGLLPSVALFGFAQLGTSPLSMVVVTGSISAIVVLPPTIFIGASFPIAARLMERGEPRRGWEVGIALALLTVGNVGGILLTAFGVIPTVGLRQGVFLLAGLNLVAALLVWATTNFRLSGRGYLVPGLAVSILLFLPLVPAWNTAVMTSGVFRHAPLYLAMLGSADRLEQAFAAYRTLFYREGSEAVVAVYDRPTLRGAPHRVLTIDGKVDASTGSDMATQLLSGHLPLLFQPDARKALVVGLASGVTVGALTKYPFERIDVVEIEPAVVDASRMFDDVSGSPLNDPRVKVIIDDGRHYLRAVPDRFDVIVSEPSNPWLSMSARLFTREFFTLIRGRLEPRGVLVQWVPLYGLSAAQFEALLRTLLDVFPNVELFHVAEGDLIAIASREPATVSPASLNRLFGDGAREGLDRVGVNTQEDLLSRWLADGTGLRTVINQGMLNTDDNGYLEFGSPWYLLSDTTTANLSTIRKAGLHSQIGNRLAEAWLSRAGGAALLKAVGVRHIGNGDLPRARLLSDTLRSYGYSIEADLLVGDAASAEGRWTEAESAWSQHRSSAFWARRAKLAFRFGAFSDAADLFAKIPGNERSPGDTIVLALTLAGLGEVNRALVQLETAFASSRSVDGVLAPFIKSILLADQGETKRSSAQRKIFETRLDDLRRCLEVDGCKDVIRSLVDWSGSLPKGLYNGQWGSLRQTLFVRVTRPLTLYHRGVSQIWLGEIPRARASLRTYLRLLPDPDPLSRAKSLLLSLDATVNENSGRF